MDKLMHPEFNLKLNGDSINDVDLSW
jgi:hypothetical protein